MRDRTLAQAIAFFIALVAWDADPDIVLAALAPQPAAVQAPVSPAPAAYLEP